jgi:hypothetical protein
MDSPHEAFALQVREVTPDSLAGDVERLGELGDVDATLAQEALHDEPTPLDLEHGAANSR